MPCVSNCMGAAWCCCGNEGTDLLPAACSPDGDGDAAAVLKGASLQTAYSSDGDAVGDAVASNEIVQLVIALRR